jgi:hypothetical protein
MAVKLYRIMQRGAKHYRAEAVDKQGRPSGRPHYGPRFGRSATGADIEIVKTIMVGYAGIGTAGDYKHEILLDEKEYANLRHMKLVPVLAREIKQTDDGMAELTTNEPILVPDDWMELPDDQKKLLASQIAKKDIKTKQLSERVIASFYAQQNDEAKED